MIGWQTAWTIARRDLSARFRGLRYENPLR